MLNDPYKESLIRKLDVLRDEIKENERKVQLIFAEIDSKQKQAEHIIELLKIEGLDPNIDDLQDFGNISLADIAFNHLERSNNPSPIHYKQLAKEILSSGKPISGKNPEANLLSHISRDDRFDWISPGTYALKKWGIQPLKSRPRRKRRKSRRTIKK
jgi:hypothetical protein